MCSDIPRITFGIIVLKGEPFTRYNLRALYPFAHEIIVVEGAVHAAGGIATPEGHSTDGTLEMLYRFKAEEDPEDKVQIVTRDGFWNEKDEQSQAYAERATGDYLWQVDIDEFYLAEDMRSIVRMLQVDPSISGISFKTRTFFGDIKCVVDGPYLRSGAEIYRRLFQWRPGYRYVSHRPPTVWDTKDNDLYLQNWVHGQDLACKGILMLHYSLLFPQQVANKAAYYENLEPYEYSPLEWFEHSYLGLEWRFRYHNVYLYRSWLERYHGKIPSAVEQMMSDIQDGKLQVTTRDTTDVERLFKSPFYRTQRAFWKAVCMMTRSQFSRHALEIARNMLHRSSQQ